MEMEPWHIVILAGGATFLCIALCTLGLASVYDPKFGFVSLLKSSAKDGRRAFGGKDEHRFDLSLFLWTMLYVVGSAIWLRSVTDGDQFGRGITYPLWKTDRPERFFNNFFFHPLTNDATELRPSVSGFTISVDAASCNYSKPEPEELEDADYCGDTNPQVPVTATIDEVAGVRQGLTLTVHASSDFRRWSQSTAVRLPRDMITYNTTVDSGALGVTTSACFGTPGAYYVVGCLRQGVPPATDATMACSEPPCQGAIGPPFSTCLAIATKCVTTCGTIATETLSPPLCRADGLIESAAIERFARRLDPLDAMFVAFVCCYTFGLLYFFIMYLPGVGIHHGAAPSWDLFVGAANEGGMAMVVPLRRSKAKKKSQRALEGGATGGAAAVARGGNEDAFSLTVMGLDEPSRNQGPSPPPSPPEGVVGTLGGPLPVAAPQLSVTPAGASPASTRPVDVGDDEGNVRANSARRTRFAEPAGKAASSQSMSSKRKSMADTGSATWFGVHDTGSVAGRSAVRDGGGAGGGASGRPAARTSLASTLSGVNPPPPGGRRASTASSMHVDRSRRLSVMPLGAPVDVEQVRGHHLPTPPLPPHSSRLLFQLLSQLLPPCLDAFSHHLPPSPTISFSFPCGSPRRRWRSSPRSPRRR